MDDLKKLKKEYKELSNELASPEIFSNPQKLQELSKRHSELKQIIDIREDISRLDAQIKENKNMLENESDEELKAMAEEELVSDKKKKKALKKELNDILNPPIGSNIKEAIVEIRAGVGGEEAALFAQDLFRMYTRYAEQKGWKVEIIEESKSDLKGIKEVTFGVKGESAYFLLKNESGVHRVQRIPETEKGGRIHTSTASVAVLPKAKPVDIEIRPEDIKFEAFRSSGPGGQNVNKVSTAVRITHLPTGIAVASQTAKSQAQNRENAMTILRSRLLKAKQEEEERKRKEKRREQIGSGERSEKIRTYNFPQDRVTDHRINKSWFGLPKIMDGNLDDIIEAITKADNDSEE
ncbi:MAG: peptide chain release factor 1 [Candidatus Spechtbacterales bacterium]|nr:peptide chain release factor 1 [Candidatus Spechtbacterales bacterium]